MTATVSVIVPARQAAGTLAECLSALRSQDWPREALEIVCVDDGSSDATPRIAGELADRVVRLLEAPRGPAAARNAGRPKACSAASKVNKLP